MNIAIVVLLCSLLSATLGAAAGWWGAFAPVSTDRRGDHSVGTAPAAVDGGKPAKQLREIRPIVTNLSAPAGAWLRVELAIILAGPANPKIELLVAEFVSDATDFLRSLSAIDIEGPNGLRRLREDLLDRARYRIGAAVESVLIETLVVQ